MDLEEKYPILEFFSYGHLPSHLREVSECFHDLAEEMAVKLLESDEVREGLRKLLEAKDCFVRAAIPK